MRRQRLSPHFFWSVMRQLGKAFEDRDTRNRAAQHLFPRHSPGAGLLHGRDNVAKTCTYRATYVPGGFNVERDLRRAERHTVVTDGVF
jgi:hypothetical protein